MHKEIPAVLKYPFTTEEVEATKNDSTNMPETEGATKPVPTENAQEDQTKTQNGGANVPATTTRSGRALKRTLRLQNSELLPKLTSFVSIVLQVTATLAKLQDGSVNELSPLFSFASSSYCR